MKWNQFHTPWTKRSSSCLAVRRMQQLRTNCKISRIRPQMWLPLQRVRTDESTDNRMMSKHWGCSPYFMSLSFVRLSDAHTPAPSPRPLLIMNYLVRTSCVGSPWLIVIWLFSDRFSSIRLCAFTHFEQNLHFKSKSKYHSQQTQVLRYEKGLIQIFLVWWLKGTRFRKTENSGHFISEAKWHVASLWKLFH